jgi:polysaccharide chain length determinant protein (PEP-CTERM system associated)
MQEILDKITAILREIWRYRWIALAVAWGICLVAWPVVLTLPNKFEAQSRVFVDPSTALKPVIQGIAIEQDVNAELNLVRQSLMSRQNLRKIVDETGLATAQMTPEAKDRVVDALGQRIDIVSVAPAPSPGEAPAPSKTYTIKYQDTDRARSMRVVQILLDSFMEGTVGGKRSDSLTAQKFVEGQIKDYEARLGEAEQRLAEFKKHNVGMVPSGTTDQQSDYFTRLQNEIDAEKKTQTALGIAVTQRAALSQQLKGEAPIAASTLQPAGGGAGGMAQGGDSLSRIRETQARLDDLLLRFTDKHPDVIALRQTLDELKARRAKELEALNQGDAGAAAATGASANPVYQSIQLALNKADVEIAGLRGELNDHHQKVADLRRMVDTMPQVEAEYARLNRDYDVNKAQYNALVDRLEKARLGGDAEATGSVRFEILDPPAADIHPVAPKRTLLLLGVLAAALAGGGAVAYLLTTIRPVFHTAQQLSEITGLAVLGVVSASRDPVKDATLRRQYFRYSMACTALIVALVVVVLVGRAFSPLSLSTLQL